MKLYDWHFAPNPRRVRMFLAEKGLSVTIEEELHSEPRLMGRDAKDKAIVEMWERRAYEGAMLAIGELLRNTNPAFVDRGLPGTAETIAQVPDLVERGRGRHSRFTKSADKQLAHNRFLAGAGFTVADITAYCALEFLNRAVKMPIPDALGNLRRWFGEISARPSAAATA